MFEIELITLSKIVFSSVLVLQFISQVMIGMVRLLTV